MKYRRVRIVWHVNADVPDKVPERRRGQQTSYSSRMTDMVREADGSVSTYDDVPVSGDTVARLLTELFSTHWAAITFGPVIEGSAWEIRLTAPPTLTMRDGYLTVDTGAWHFHLCVDDHHARGDAALAIVRRVGRTAF